MDCPVRVVPTRAGGMDPRAVDAQSRHLGEEHIDGLMGIALKCLMARKRSSS